MQSAVETKSEKTKQIDTDIVDIILEDHKPLKDLIKIMKDSERDHEERFAAFNEFAPTLIAHAKPEEETLYVFMKKDEDLREEGCEGDVEHMLADQLLEEIKRTTDKDMKAARIKVLAELVEHHIEEEEEELLPEFQKEAEKSIRSKLGNKFLELKLNYLAAGDDNVIPDPRVDNSQKTH
ncbi:MAG: hemerythrin domain-containing protein [Pseudobdellovibrio sp.]